MLKLFRYLKNYKLESVVGPLFKLIEACFELAVPIVMAKIIDVGIAQSDKSYIIKMGGILILLGVLGLACSLTAQYFAAKAALGFGTELRRDLYHHINTLSHSEIDKVGTSTLVTRMTVDINQAQTGVNMLLRLFLRSPFIVLGAIIMAFTVSVKLTMIFLIASPILALIIYLVMSKTVPMFKKIQKKLDKTSLRVSENLSGVRVIRAFSRQKNEEVEFKQNADELLDLQKKAGRISALMNPATFVIVYVAIIAIIWYGGVDVNVGGITQGELIALTSYMNQVLLALLAVAILVTSMTKMQASSSRINDVFAIKSSINDDGNTAKSEDENAPAVQFKDVDFTYSGSEEPALLGINFTADRGETIGIIGSTGSGKSTLVNLIPRFYQHSTGSVLVDGVEVSDYPFEQLRGKIGFVLQKATLFKGTIRDNMKWRNQNATDEEINKALEIAQAIDFVNEKPEKLDYKILQAGRNLSGGQKQRLTIARALVGSPEILILDDSASALDLATDAKLRKAIADKTNGMTVFIVSQRVSSIRNADKILVLDEGELVGAGTHSQLINECEVYKEICLSQLTAEEVAKNG